MRWQTLGAALLVVVGVGAAAFAVIGPDLGGTAATEYLTSQAAVTDVVEQVEATGTLEAATTYSLAFGSAPTEVASGTSATGASASTGAATSSWIVETVDAVPGQAVAAGDVLATADGTDAELGLASAEATLASANARLASDRRGLTKTDRAAAKLQVTQAIRSLGQARSSYSSTVAQNRLKVSQAAAAVTRARKALRQARADGQRSSIDQAVDQLTQAKESLASLRLQVGQSNTQAANQVSSAQLQLQSARIAYRQKTAKADAATLATDAAAVAEAQQAVEAARAALDHASLVSPVDGVVVSVAITPGLAAPATGAITVRSNAFQVAAAVTESDLPLLRIGQDATVTISALDTDVVGTVETIDQEATSSEFGVVSYAVVVSLAEAPEGAATGMTAELSVTTESADDVLAVPAIALDTALDGTYTIQVLDATGQPQAVAVEVGLITSSLAEITSGIDEGTAVVIGTASDRNSTTTTTTGIPGLGGGLPGGQFPRQQP